MSGRMKKQAVCLQMLIKTKNAKLREAILEHADAELIRALCECAHNILRGNVKMTPRERKGTRGPAMTKGPGDRRRGPEGSRY